MPKAPSPRSAALDSRQLDLPLFDGADCAPGDGSGASAPRVAPSATPSAPPQAPVAAPSSSPLVPPTRSRGTAPDGSRLRSLQLGPRRLEYRLKRSSRRTIGFSIDGTGLAVTAPRWVTIADIEAAIADKQRWIFAKLAEWQTRVEQRALPRIEWTEGAQFPYLGRMLTITLTSPTGTLVHDAARAILALGLPQHAHAQQIKDRVQGWLQHEAKRLFGERLDMYAERLGVRHRAYALSSATTRWGSCSSDGKIRLNWRLIHFPLSIIDYVVAHELAHLREMNHSPRFWNTVASIFPEFREARNSLKNHPPELLPAL